MFLCCFICNIHTSCIPIHIFSQAEFGKVNGHFHVPNPDFDAGDVSDSARYDTGTEAMRFYRWVNSLHVEYEAFRSGNGSKILNDERVLQLVKLGFQFKNRV